MKLLNEIVDEAVDDKTRLVTLLRKCLVLADELSNDSLRNWSTFELNGYPNYDELPKYRIVSITAKGNFLGGFGAQINNQPLPSAVLQPDHQWWAETTYLNEPIASYETLIGNPKENGPLIVHWPADMVVYYQAKFFEGYALNRAWQEIPMGAIVAAVDTVRTRILQFALEIRRELGAEGAPEAVPEPARVEQAVQTIIYGGNNIVGSTVAGDVQLVGQQLVIQGDFGSLAEFLQEEGVGAEHIAELEQAIAEDKEEGAERGFGRRVAGWMQKAGTYVGKEGSKAAAAAAGKIVTTAVLTYFGVGN